MSVKKFDTISFVQHASNLHKNKYDYSLFNYVHLKHKSTIICKKHNLKFLQSPDKHLNSKNGGCPLCSPIGKGFEFRKNPELFKILAREIHGNRYDYSKTIFIASNKRLTITCKKHGDIEVYAGGHLDGTGCQKCAKNYRYTSKEILEKLNKIHKNKYEYNELELKNMRCLLNVKCKKHGTFKINMTNHMRGFGCSICSSLKSKCKSKGEQKIESFLKRYNVEYHTQKFFDDCIYKNKLKFDFFIPKKNIIIEYDGKQHFVPVKWFGGEEYFKISKEKDEIKNEYCRKNNINLIRIPYFEKNVEKILSEICL